MISPNTPQKYYKSWEQRQRMRPLHPLPRKADVLNNYTLSNNVKDHVLHHFLDHVVLHIDQELAWYTDMAVLWTNFI